MICMASSAIWVAQVLHSSFVWAASSAPKGFDEHGRTIGWVDGCFGDLASDESINHTGYTGTSMAIDAENGVAVILLANRVHPVDDGSLARLRATVENIVLAALDK